VQGVAIISVLQLQVASAFDSNTEMGIIVVETARRRSTEVLAAAAKLFYTKGYEATSVQDLADALGILKGSVYHYIRTKEDLLFAVVEDAHAASIANVDKLRSLEGDAPTKIAAFVGAHLELLIRERIKLGVYLHDFRSLSSAHRRTVSAQRREYSDYLLSLIEQGQQEGTVAADLDANVTTIAILGMLNWTHEWYRDRGRASREALIEKFIQIVQRTVAA